MKKLLITFITTIYLFGLNVSVSILPQKFVIDKISNNSIDVNVMIPKGASPVSYSPKPRQLFGLKKSKIYFSVGVPFEKAWLNKFRSVNPKIEIIYFGKYLKTDKNPHIWLDPIFLIDEAKVVKEALIKLEPSKKTFYENNYKKFKKECLNLDKTFRETLNHQKFIIFHPNLYYFAKRYNLTEIALEKQGKEPSIKYLLKIIKIAKQNNIKLVLTSPEFSKKSAKFLAQKIGGKVIDFSALDYDIFNNLKRVVKLLNDNN